MPEGRWLGAGPKPERYQAIVTQDLNFADTTNSDGTYSPNVWKAKSPFAAKARRRSPIALQIHDGVVAFCDIKIRPLSINP